jgi:hypothetical protein
MTKETANEMTQFGEIEVVRNVTLPFIIIPADGVPFYMKFNTAIEPDKTTFSERVRKGKVNADGTQQSAEPMHIAEVTNLQSGEVGRLVAHQVLESNLDEAYPNAGYVGKYFKISKQKSAKRYFTFNIVEIKLKAQDGGKNTGAKK